MTQIQIEAAKQMKKACYRSRGTLIKAILAYVEYLMRCSDCPRNWPKHNQVNVSAETLKSLAWLYGNYHTAVLGQKLNNLQFWIEESGRQIPSESIEDYHVNSLDNRMLTRREIWAGEILSHLVFAIAFPEEMAQTGLTADGMNQRFAELDYDFNLVLEDASEGYGTICAWMSKSTSVEVLRDIWHLNK